MKKVLFTIMILMLSVNLVNAASYSVSVGTKSLTKGGSTNLTIKGSDVTGRFNIRTSDASVVSVSESSIWIENNSFKITLKALKVGDATITVTPAAGTSDSNGNAANLSSKSVKITVALPREKSSNNNLKSLSVDGYELSPAFDANTLEYTTTVPSTVDKINIKAQKADNYASISGIGEFEVSEGVNEFEVIVTSETRKDKVYKVIVNVEDLNPIEVEYEGESYTVVKNPKNLVAPPNYTETTVQIENNVVPGFYNDYTKYQLVGLKDSAGTISLFVYDNGKYDKYCEIKGESVAITPIDFPELDIPKELMYTVDKIDFNGSKVEALILGGGNLENAKHAWVYGINIATGEKAYYHYSFVDKTLQYDNDLYILEALYELINQYDKYSYIILGTSVGCAILLILTITFAICNHSKKKILKKYIEKKEKALEQTAILNTKDIEEASKKETKKVAKKEVIETNEDLEEATYNLFDEDKKKKKTKSKNKNTKIDK